MSFISKMKEGFSRIRRPDRESQYNHFMKDYGWSFRQANKFEGDLQVYYEAMNNPYINRCISVYVDESLSNGFSVSNPDDTENNNEKVNYLTDLFQNPRGKQSNMTFTILNSQIWRSWLGTGDCFIEVNYDTIFDNVPDGFNFIPTEQMYYYQDTEQWGLRNSEYRYEDGELIHIYQPGIRMRDQTYGQSPIDTIAMSVALEYLGMKHNKSIFEDNGLDPRGVLSFDKDISIDRFNNEIKRLQNTKNKKGLITGLGINYQSTNRSNKDMDFINLMNYSRDRVFVAFGVPPAKASVIETASLGSGTGESQDKNWQKTLSGKCKFIEDQFNKILGRHGFSEVFQYGREDIENKLTRAQIEQIQVNTGVTTVNEVRGGYGLNPVPWGDVPRTQNTGNVNYPQQPLSNVKRLKNNVYHARLLSEWSDVKW